MFAHRHCWKDTLSLSAQLLLHMHNFVCSHCHCKGIVGSVSTVFVSEMSVIVDGCEWMCMSGCKSVCQHSVMSCV